MCTKYLGDVKQEQLQLVSLQGFLVAGPWTCLPLGCLPSSHRCLARNSFTLDGNRLSLLSFLPHFLSNNLWAIHNGKEVAVDAIWSNPRLGIDATSLGCLQVYPNGPENGFLTWFLVARVQRWQTNRVWLENTCLNQRYCDSTLQRLKFGWWAASLTYPA